MVYFLINPNGLKLNERSFEDKYSRTENLSRFEFINSAESNLSENSSESIICMYRRGDKYESLVISFDFKLRPASDAKDPNLFEDDI